MMNVVAMRELHFVNINSGSGNATMSMSSMEQIAKQTDVMRTEIDKL